METKNLTVVFTDMKGFTNRTFLTSRREIALLLNIQDKIIRSSVRKFAGKIIKTMGDGYLIVFDSPTNAVLAALFIQKKVAKHNLLSNPSLKFELRIGINSGEVELKEGDIFGDAVNIASRVQGLASPGSVLLTEPVFLSMNKNEIPLSVLGYKKIKGLPKKIKLYKVLLKFQGNKTPYPIIGGFVLLILLALGLSGLSFDFADIQPSPHSDNPSARSIRVDIQSGYAAEPSNVGQYPTFMTSPAPSSSPVGSPASQGFQGVGIKKKGRNK